MDTIRGDKDVHSYYEPGLPAVEHLELVLEPNFAGQFVWGSVTLRFDQSGHTYLDTRDLAILSVFGLDGRPIDYTEGGRHNLLGTRLGVTVPADKAVIIKYKTGNEASGLQWLTPEQTGGPHPFLFSQGEAINARSYVPCQDTPSRKVTFQIKLRVPQNLRGLAAATFVKREELANGLAEETWSSLKPLPSYLIAFAVGNLVCRDLSPRIRVWAGPGLIGEAAQEFEDLPQILAQAENLFGTYPWDRYDVLVMPAAFPYGGMENQGLTFVSPTLITGDKSLVSVVAHELAHSWFGNLVTNATWSDFWLNEGWTMWAEHKLVRAVFGELSAKLGWIGMNGELTEDMRRHHETGQPQFNQLWYEPDSNIDPDDAFSRVPYQKGFLFLMALEEAVGEAAFMEFARQYMDNHAFKSITTEEFVHFVEMCLPGTLEQVSWRDWIYGSTLPNNAPQVQCDPFQTAMNYAQRGEIMTMSMNTHPLLVALFLEHFRRPMEPDHSAIMGGIGIARHLNTEIRFQFLRLVIESGRLPSTDLMTGFLGTIGRMKYITPLYRALAKNPSFRKQGEKWFEEFRSRYHPVAAKAIERTFRQTAAG